MRRGLEPVAAALWLFLLALPVSIAAMNLAAGLLTLALLWRLAVRRDLSWEPAWTASVGAVSAYAACGLLAAALAPDPGTAFKEAAKDLHKVWILLIALPSLRAAPQVRPERPLALGLGAMALLGLWQTAFLKTGDSAWLRAHGFVHPVTFGQQMALGVLGAVCFLRTEALRRQAAGILALLAAAMVLSQTRAAILGLAAGIVALGLAQGRARRAALSALAVGVLVLAAWELLPTGGRSIRHLFERPDVQAGRLVNPNQARWVLWDAALSMFRDRPLTGVGPNGYAAAFPRYFKGDLDGEHVWGSAHNLYLHQLAERGLLGVAGLLCAFGALAWLAWKRARSPGGPLPLWSWAAVAAFLVMNLTETAFQSEQISAFFLAVWALGQAGTEPSA